MDFFSWLQYDFMRYAFLAVLIITPLFGLMGTMIVNRKMAFFSDALGHSALTGIAVGVALGVDHGKGAGPQVIIGQMLQISLRAVKAIAEDISVNGRGKVLPPLPSGQQLP